jgi:hypothetical protein
VHAPHQHNGMEVWRLTGFLTCALHCFPLSISTTRLGRCPNITGAEDGCACATIGRCVTEEGASTSLWGWIAFTHCKHKNTRKKTRAEDQKTSTATANHDMTYPCLHVQVQEAGVSQLHESLWHGKDVQPAREPVAAWHGVFMFMSHRKNACTSPSLPGQPTPARMPDGTLGSKQFVVGAFMFESQYGENDCVFTQVELVPRNTHISGGSLTMIYAARADGKPHTTPCGPHASDHWGVSAHTKLSC